jgi:N6-L-threonylcarbamoyladenine synthase
VASRQHILQISPIVRRALDDAGVPGDGLDAVAVVHGPGLAGSLLVGLNAAKALAFGLGLPLLAVNHLEAHIYASWLYGRDPEAEAGFPLLCLIVSGGHTDMVLMEGHGRYRLLGRTRDDAAGEAFDKAARVLGLGYPGGPAVQRVAREGRASERFPRAWLDGTWDFSFSGLKTAVLRRAQEVGVYPPPQGGPDPVAVRELAHAFQESVVDVLASKTASAALDLEAKGVVLGGGVVANARLREVFQERVSQPLFIPPLSLCTDNGAMVAACACYQLARGQKAPLALDVAPGARIG